ncbi:TPA: HNH endonuclease [Morganella morganii]
MFNAAYLKSLELRKPITTRLMSRIEMDDKSGCWVFMGGRDRCGYGRIKVGPHNLGAHKVAYLMLVGDYDQTNLELMHTCDNPACINPEHLIPATHKENIADCINKGRHTSQIYKHVISRKRGGIRDNNHNVKVNGSILIAFFSPRKLAIALDEKNYCGSICEKHQMTIRKTNNGACIYCMEEYRINKTKSRRDGR